MCLSSVPQSYLGSHIGLGSSQQERLDVGPKLRIWRWFQDWFPECPGSSTPRGLKVALFRVPCCHLDSQGRFNQKLTLPSSLSLTFGSFGDKFNQSLVGVIFPSSQCGGRDVPQPPPQSQSKGWSVLQLWIYQNVWLKVVVSLSSTSKWEWRRVYELESVPYWAACVQIVIDHPRCSRLYRLYLHCLTYIIPRPLGIYSHCCWLCPQFWSHGFAQKQGTLRFDDLSSYHMLSWFPYWLRLP